MTDGGDAIGPATNFEHIYIYMHIERVILSIDHAYRLFYIGNVC